jgi:pimeloyl-ACP methyl ester carboxylesterase
LGLNVEPFSISVDEAVLTDLRTRIDNTRWPPRAPGARWEHGADPDYLHRLLAYWAEEFDWRARERELNRFAQFRAELDGGRLHFIHERARRGQGIPLIMTNGWPSNFVELLPLVPLLTDPETHGIEGPAFDLVIPSLPGYGFSERPASVGVNYRYVAGLWHRLMQGLGYTRYGAGGGDFGAGVSTLMALDEPQRLIGLHLSNLELSPYLGPESRPLSSGEDGYLQQSDRFWQVEGGYKEIQATKPQTLAYALNDSPAGLAAWILDRWRSWADSGGDLDGHFTRDLLLTVVTLYWVTQTMPTSILDYFDNRWYGVELGPDDFVHVPTAITVFPQFVSEGKPPREWAERLYNVRRWTRMPTGGHFAPVEEPERLAQDIASFFARITPAARD